MFLFKRYFGDVFGVGREVFEDLVIGRFLGDLKVKVILYYKGRIWFYRVN